MDLKWIEPESRLLVELLFRRKFDTFTDDAKRTTNWAVLIGNVAVFFLVLSLL